MSTPKGGEFAPNGWIWLRIGGEGGIGGGGLSGFQGV